MLIGRGRGYQNLRYLLLKAKRMAVTNIEFIAVNGIRKPPKNVSPSNSRAEPELE